MLTTKKLHVKSIIHELLWFLSGDTNIGYLNENGVSIWNEWADENGDLGPVMAANGEVANFGWSPHRPDFATCRAIDVKSGIAASHCDGRNPADVDDMALPPCHCLFQFYVADGKLSCQLYQRSADIFLGVPFNIASYALLTLMLAQVCDWRPAISSTRWVTRTLSEPFGTSPLCNLTHPGALPSLRITPTKRYFRLRF